MVSLPMCEISVMALLRYLTPIGGLPDPRGSLSSSVPAQAIAEANKAAQKVLTTSANIAINVVPTRGTAPSMSKLQSMPVSMV